MSVILNAILLVLTIIVAVMLAMPVLIGFMEKFYSRYCNWVWDKLNV